MVIKKIFSVFFISIFLSQIFAPKQFASQKDLPVITVINPVREPGMEYVPGKLVKSIAAQFKITNDEHIPATWLWQYAVLYDKPVVDFAKAHESGQEYGLFLEIGPQLAHDAHVVYRGVGPWYFSNGLLLSSYDTIERQKIIDTSFFKFKTVFGYYPKTVGAWWIGADSLNYMHKKYGVVASLRAADQFDLDVYSIWGTPWSIPYVAAKENAAIPATSLQNSTGVVQLQWAARDPLQGYGPGFANGTFSVQDYSLKGYGTDYFLYLMKTFLRKPLDNIVVGLEGGFDPAGYSGEYKDKLEVLKQLQADGKISVQPAKDYANIFLQKNKTIAPTNYLLTTDFKTNNQSFWFNSSLARVGIQKIGDIVYLVDMRNYPAARAEDFLVLPNSQPELRINTPAVIDSARNPSEKKVLVKTNDPLEIKNANGSMGLFAGKMKIAEFTTSAIHLFSRNSLISLPPIAPMTEQGVHVFWILLVILMGYTIFVWFLTKSFAKTLLHFIILCASLLIAKQFLSVNFSASSTFLFDRKSFFLFLIPSFQFISQPVFITLLFQIIPFLLLLITHFLFAVKKITKFHVFFSFLSVGGYMFLYANLPYFPLDKTTYIILFVLFALVGLLFLTMCILIYAITKSVKKLFFSLSCTFMVLILGIFLVLFSRQEYAISPFEQDALNIIRSQNKKVLFLLPKEKPVYKAVRPLLYDYQSAGQQWTHSVWEKSTGVKLVNKDWIIFVPRYLGSQITDNEIQKYHLIKIFDNAQIALYEAR